MSFLEVKRMSLTSEYESKQPDLHSGLWIWRNLCEWLLRVRKSDLIRTVLSGMVVSPCTRPLSGRNTSRWSFLWRYSIDCQPNFKTNMWLYLCGRGRLIGSVQLVAELLQGHWCPFSYGDPRQGLLVQAVTIRQRSRRSPFKGCLRQHRYRIADCRRNIWVAHNMSFNRSVSTCKLSRFFLSKSSSLPTVWR
jgi:hypothetical protein